MNGVDLEQKQREEARWRTLRVLDAGRPIAVSENIVWRILNDLRLSLSLSGVHRELDYLRTLGLLEIDGEQSGTWYARLTARGVDVVEYDTHEGPMRPRGIVRLYNRRRLLWEEKNLFVNTGLPLLANLIAGVTTGQCVTAIGFGSSGTAPSASDTGLAGTPAYYKAIGTSSFPSPGSVQFDYTLSTTDYGAVGMTIQELGLFANSTPIALPSAIGNTNPSWAASTAEAMGNLIVDSNNNIQYCSTAGTTGSAAPPWATTFGSTTSDNGVVWTLVAFNNVPLPLIAHVAVPSFAYTGTGNYSGTWTLTF